MKAHEYGAVALNEQDRGYEGSRYAEVKEAIFANPYYSVWGAADARPLPVYEVTFAGAAAGILPFGSPFRFLQASERTVDSNADLRWGDDRKGFRRILHPNGVCLTGVWEITEETGYTGYFRKGSKALTIGRYSTCCTETRRGHVRSLALVGKLYPTTDVSHPMPLRTASFITQQDFGGDFSRSINDAELRNAPDTRSWRRGSGVPVLLLTGAVLLKADKQPTHRQLYQIAELGEPEGEKTRTPEFMRLIPVPEQPRIEGDDLDFRDEILAQIYDKGNPAPQRTLTFQIDVSDTGETKGTPLFERRIITDWRTIGRLTFTEAVASYNGDFVLHFNHPTWRDDRNDPATATRVGGRKVR
ncbi:MAG: hypothetical protein ACU83V_04435 [Gammaproteobacteria bacterium]